MSVCVCARALIFQNGILQFLSFVIPSDFKPLQRDCEFCIPVNLAGNQEIQLAQQNALIWYVQETVFDRELEDKKASDY